MPAPSPNAWIDSIDSTNLGMHAGIAPHLLNHNQIAFGVNLANRGGQPSTRPPFRKCSLTFADGLDSATVTQALFQGAHFYQGINGNPNCLVTAIGGKLFRWRPGSGQSAMIDDISGGIQRNPTARQNWMWQAEDFLISNDGLDYPLFFDGASTRKSAGPAGQELPTGTAGSYINGRVVMALPNQQSWIAGDLVYSTASGTPAYNYRDSVLKTTENQSILAGAAFGIPVTAGPITAIFAVAVPDTSLGQGSIFIGTAKGVFSANLPLDATLWTTTQQPSQVVSLPSAGPMGHYAVSLINGDGWYRANDGLRSYQVARREFNSWVQTSLSFEMSPILSLDTTFLLQYASLVSFNNRMLATCSPQFVMDRGTAWSGIVSLDFSNISSLTTRDVPPAYDGLWTGLQVLQLVEGRFNGVDRCFAFALDGNNDICLYEIMSDSSPFVADWNGTAEVSTQCRLESNALFGLDNYTSANVRMALKKFLTIDLYLEKLSGTVSFDLKYRTDQMADWRDWKTFSLCASATSCDLPNCTVPKTLQPIYATYKRMPFPADDCNPITKRLYRTGYQIQVRIDWAGEVQLRKAIAWAQPIDEIVPGCPTEEACIAVEQCPESYFTYSIEG